MLSLFCLLFKSRLIFLSIIIFIVLELIVKKFSNSNKLLKQLDNLIFSNSFYFVILSFAISTIFVCFLSFIWVSLFPISSLKEYKSSFNDGSNAIRVRANIYAIDEIINNPQLIYSGYDKHLLEHMNIESNPNGNSYMGLRLVQPHEFFLNIIL